MDLEPESHLGVCPGPGARCIGGSVAILTVFPSDLDVLGCNLTAKFSYDSRPFFDWISGCFSCFLHIIL